MPTRVRTWAAVGAAAGRAGRAVVVTGPYAVSRPPGRVVSRDRAGRTGVRGTPPERAAEPGRAPAGAGPVTTGLVVVVLMADLLLRYGPRTGSRRPRTPVRSNN
ncbi:hypothetical protein GCM10027047_37690 [Rhodococcus aerolatus]